MTTRTRVAVLRTRPETVLQDYQRLFELVEGAKTLDSNATTIIKDNISWHFPMPSANTTPWQLESAILALRQAGFADLVAIDAVAAKLMGFDPLGIKYIRLAHERGLGVGDVAEIELVGDDLSGENCGFEVSYSFHRFLAWMAWYGPTRFLQKLVLRTPLVAIPTLISEANHDYIHWPLKERHVYEKWRANITWGQLFQQYQRQGHLVN